MGACGCGDTNIDFTFPAPNGDTYAVEVHPGCRDCGYEAGILIHRFTPEEADVWAGDCPEVTPNSDGIGIPVIADGLTELIDDSSDAFDELASEGEPLYVQMAARWTKWREAAPVTWWRGNAPRLSSASNDRRTK